MRIYLSGSYERRDELRKYRDQLIELGYTVTSSWIDESHSTKCKLSDLTADELAEMSERDCGDIWGCELFIGFTEPDGSSRTRGGRHVELGMAMALGRDVYIVGPRENVFHWDDAIEHFDSWEECLAYITDEGDGE